MSFRRKLKDLLISSKVEVVSGMVTIDGKRYISVELAVKLLNDIGRML